MGLCVISEVHYGDRYKRKKERTELKSFPKSRATLLQSLQNECEVAYLESTNRSIV